MENKRNRMLAVKVIWRKLVTVINKEKSPDKIIRSICYGITNAYYDRRLNIATIGNIYPKDLEFECIEFHHYVPIGYSAIRKALKEIPLPVSQCTLLEVGSGKGRVIAMAASRAYRRVIGIELSEKLHQAALDNIGRMRHKKSASIELLNVDAVQYSIPDDVNILFFFNPFNGTVLNSFIQNIKESVDRAPRTIYIIYFNNHCFFEDAIRDCGWLKKIKQEAVYPDRQCGIYVTKA